MKKRIPVLLLGAILPLAAMASPQLQSGKWVINNKIEMSGMPFQIPTKTNTRTQCKTPKQSKKTYKQMIKQMQEAQGKTSCKLEDYGSSNNNFHWTMTCNASQPMTMNGTMTIADSKHYQTQVVMHNAAGMKVTTSSKAHWAGSCD